MGNSLGHELALRKRVYRRLSKSREYGVVAIECLGQPGFVFHGLHVFGNICRRGLVRGVLHVLGNIRRHGLVRGFLHVFGIIRRRG